MPSVNVSSEEIKKQAAELSKASTEIDRTRKSIVSQYQQLGTTWNDAKYKALGDIVQESNSSLRNIEKIFLQSQKALLSILSVVQEYEASNLYPTGAVSGGISDGGSDGGFTRHLSPDEVNARWQSGVESINEQIANYREALLSRGVPECKWLNETLAKHRAQMLEQQGYDLDVASGHGADSVHNGDAYHYPGDYNEFYNQLADEFRQHSLTETNPHYSEAPHWRDNCQRCVPALEMRRRGEEVTARPSTYGSSHLAYRPFDVWQNPTVLHTQGTGMEQIDNSMASWGDGARAQVVVYWDGPHGGGHTFIAERRNGETIFSDPQTGRMDVSNYFGRVIPNTTQYCRIDNLEFSSYIDECYQEVA